MNLRKGGSGGFDYINQTGLGVLGGGIKGGVTRAKRYQEDPAYATQVRKIGCENLVSSGATERARVANLGNTRWKGRTHSEATKKLMSERKKGTSTGSKNSQFGTFWITDGTSNKKCRGDIPEGWRRGLSLRR